MDKIVEHWIERSQYDLDTAKVMLDTGRYLYVSYMCQQAVEKLLKRHHRTPGQRKLSNSQFESPGKSFRN